MGQLGQLAHLTIFQRGDNQQDAVCTDRAGLIHLTRAMVKSLTWRTFTRRVSIATPRMFPFSPPGNDSGLPETDPIDLRIPPALHGEEVTSCRASDDPRRRYCRRRPERCSGGPGILPEKVYVRQVSSPNQPIFRLRQEYRARGDPEHLFSDREISVKYHLLADPVIGKTRAGEIEDLLLHVDGAGFELDKLFELILASTE